MLMANKRLSMRKIEEVLRLHFAGGRSNREISEVIRVSPTTVGDYLRRARFAGLSWPLPSGMTEAALEAKLFPSLPPSNVRRPEPDWAMIHRELSRKGVTLELLWQEFREQHPDGFQYSAFCQHYRAFAHALPVTLRKSHTPGEELFVDYSGQTMGIIDPRTGDIKQAQIFVAVLGVSNYTFVEATWTQGLADWTGSHVRCLEFMGGVPAAIVPDNLKSGVTKPCFYDPDINPSYQDFARHYEVTISPARVRKPRDKAKVEAGVLLAQRWILARLRHLQFFSLAEVNQAISPLLTQLNQRQFKKMPGSRQSVFEAMDYPALKPLPTVRYEFAEWKKATVGIDYHIEVERHYYSVPYRYARQKVDVRFTANTVEAFSKSERIACHLRSWVEGHHTSIAEHMPPSHQSVEGWNGSRFLAWAAKIGPKTEAAIDQVLRSRKYQQQSYRRALGILRLDKSYGAERLEAACARAIKIQSVTYRSIHSILKNGLDRLDANKPKNNPTSNHVNVRGPDYYH